MPGIIGEYPEGCKICNTCGEEKLLSEFHFQRSLPTPGQSSIEAERGRYRGNCKLCQREYMRLRRIEKIKEEGSDYLESETRRVRTYYNREDRLEQRRAVDRARYTAYTILRERHPMEYEELLTQARVYEGVPNDTPR
jgi:hypothetical protein